jgi:hypothetical protein
MNANARLPENRDRDAAKKTYAKPVLQLYGLLSEITRSSSHCGTVPDNTASPNPACGGTPVRSLKTV